jgi:iron complex outermembrane recepter protein
MKAPSYALALALIVIGTTANAQDAAPVRIHIASTSVVDAINQWAQQTGFRVVWAEDASTSTVVPQLDGTFTPRQALVRLLKNTRLQAEFTDAHTAVISKGAPAAKHDDSRTSNQTADGPAGLEEVIVSAQKREERLIDVPISINVIGGEELQARHITDINDLQLAVPGLGIWNAVEGRTISIRGIGNDNGSSSLVGVYLDEADVTSQSGGSQPAINTYDLDRVEVLRGPQGTLFGEGSAGGTVRYVTKTPDLNNFSFDSEVAAMTTQDGAPSQRVQGVLNVPLIGNELGLRIAGLVDNEGGWIDQPTAGQRDINGHDTEDVRVKVLWQPLRNLTVSALAEVNHEEGGWNIGEDANGNYTQSFGLTTTPHLVNHFQIYNLTLTYNFDSIRLVSTTSDFRQGWNNANLGWAFPANCPGNAPGACSPITVFDPFYSGSPYWNGYKPSSVQWEGNLTQEVRLSTDNSGPWQWTVGGWGRRYNFQRFENGYYGPAGSLPAGSVDQNLNTWANSWSAFADTSYRFLDRLTVGAGVRYFKDDRKTTIGGEQSATFKSTDPRAYIQYKLVDGANLYTSAAKGFRSGGFNSLDQPAYGPESVWTYELGAKVNVLEGHLSADTALFYSKYTHYQIFGLVTQPQILFITSNAGDAHVKGVEWDLSWVPIDDWRISLNGDYLQTEFTRTVATGTEYNVGDPINLIPKYQATLSVQRDFRWNEHPGFARLDYSREGRETFQDVALGPYYRDESDIINMLSFNSGINWSENLRLGLFVQNLLNDRGYMTAAHILASAERARPRTFGVEFGVRF